MSTQSKYPQTYDVIQTLSEFCTSRFLIEFARQKGIFITNAKLSERAEFLSGLFFDSDELEKIRDNALGNSGETTLSGFWLEIKDEDFDLIKELKEYSNTQIDSSYEMELGNLTGSTEKGFKGVVTYQQKSPGRFQFLQGTQRDFVFYLNPKYEGKWEIVVDGSRSNDARLLSDWLRKEACRSVESKITSIEQEKLSTKQMIGFFDELSKKAVTKDWKFNQVKRITIRRESQIDDEDDDEVSEADVSVLTGITQAILEGQNLRTNDFVRQCEDGGYRFTSMSYEYENNKLGYLMEVRAEFKLKPKVFEVALDRYIKVSGIEGKHEDAVMPSDEKTTLLKRFYSTAKNIFDNLVGFNISSIEEIS